MFYKPFVRPQADEAQLLRVSRWPVIFWGAIFAAMAWQFSASSLDLVTLAYSMNTYTLGPMPGLFGLSMINDRYRVTGIGTSVMASIAPVIVINEPWMLNPLFGTRWENPLLSWPWLFPIDTLTCFLPEIHPGQAVELCIAQRKF